MPRTLTDVSCFPGQRAWVSPSHRARQHDAPCSAQCAHAVSPVNARHLTTLSGVQPEHARPPVGRKPAPRASDPGAVSRAWPAATHARFWPAVPGLISLLVQASHLAPLQLWVPVPAGRPVQKNHLPSHPTAGSTPAVRRPQAHPPPSASSKPSSSRCRPTRTPRPTATPTQLAAAATPHPCSPPPPPPPPNPPPNRPPAGSPSCWSQARAPSALCA